MDGKSARDSTILLSGARIPAALDEEMIRDVVHGFYRKVRDDALIGPIFDSAIAPDLWPVHLSKMCDFWSSMLLKTSRYDGRPLRPHLQIPELGEEHFRRWLTLFQATVTARCPPDVAALFLERAFRIAHSFRLAIATNRGENAADVEPIHQDELQDTR